MHQLAKIKLRNNLWRVFLILSLITFFLNMSWAACPTPGATTTAAGTPADMCGNSSTGGPLNKTCCISAGDNNVPYMIYNGNSPVTAYISYGPGCTDKMMIPGQFAAEWTSFSVTHKPPCITFMTAPPAFTWTGRGTDNKWSNQGNWSTYAVPGALDTANFDGTYFSSTGTTISIDANVSVAAVNITANFPATTMTANAVSIAVGASGWSHISTSAVAVDLTSATSFTVTGTTTLAGAGTLTLSSTTSTLAATSIAGTFSLNTKGTSNIGAFTGTAGTATFSGTTNLTSTSSIVAATINANTATVVATSLLTMSGGTYTSTTGSNTFNGGITQTGGTFNGGNAAGSTLSVTGTTAISGAATDFLTAQNTSDFTGPVNFSATTVASTFTTYGTTRLLGASGNLTTSGALSLVSINGTFSVAGTWTASNSVITTTSASVTVTGLFSLSAGSYTTTSGSNTFNGGITQTGGTTFNAGNAAGSTLTVVGTTAISGTATDFLTAQTTSDFTGAVNFTATTSASSFTTYGTTRLIGASGNLTTSGSASLVSINGTFSVAGTWAASNAVITTTTSTVTTTGLFTLSGGSYTSTSGTNNFTGGFTQSTANSQFVGGSSTNTVGATGFAFNIAGTAMTFNGGSGNWTISGPFALGGTWSTTTCPTPACFTFSTGTTQIAGNVTFPDIALASNVANTGTLTLLTNGTQTFTTNTTKPPINNINFNFANTTGPNNVAFSGLTALTATGNVGFNAGVGCGANCTVDAAGAMTLTVQNGNITATGHGAQGALIMNLTGTASSISADTYLPSGLITVSKATTATTVTVSSGGTTNVIGNMTITTGTVTMSGAFTVKPLTSQALTINNGGVLLCNGNTLSALNPKVNSGGVLTCAGYGYNWIGATNRNWNTASNWSGGAVPTSTSSVVFDVAWCVTVTNCNCTINAAANAYSISAYTGYTGTVTQGANNITVDVGGMNIAAGTFNGATTNALSNAGLFQMTGGTWAAGSGANSHAGTFTLSGGTYTPGSGATNTFTGAVTINGGTFGQGTGTNTFSSTTTLSSGTFYSSSGANNFTGNFSQSGGTFNTTTTRVGALTFSGTFAMTGGTYYATNGAMAVTGATTIGAASTFTGSSGALTFSNTFDITSATGTFIGGSGTNNFSGNSVNASIVTGSVFTPTTGTTNFNTTSATLALKFNAGTIGTFGNLNIQTGGTTAITTAGIMTTTGNLNIGDTQAMGTITSGSTGSIKMTGTGVTATGTGFGYNGDGTVDIIMAPAASQSQTITSGSVSPGVQLPGLTIAGTGGTIIYSNFVTPAFYTYTTGTLTTTGSTLYFQQSGTYSSANHTVNNVTFSGASKTHSIDGAGSMTVGGLLTLNDTGGTGAFDNAVNGTQTINSTGNITISGYGMPQNPNSGNYTIINLNGTSLQTITGTTNASAATTGDLPSLTIANTSGGVKFLNFINVSGDYKYTSGTLTVTSSTLNFASNDGGNGGSTITHSAAATYNNVSFTPVITSTYTFSNVATSNFNVGNTSNVGLLSFNEGVAGKTITMKNGQINAYASVTVAATTSKFPGTVGSATIINVTGTGSQTITGSTGASTLPALSLNSTGGTVTLSSTGIINIANDYTYTSGAVSVTGSTLNFAGVGNSTITDPGSVSYNNVTFSPTATTTYTFAGTPSPLLKVGGLLTFAEGGGKTITMTGGTINAYAGVTIGATSQKYRGTNIVNVTGAAAQTILGSNTTSTIQCLTINSTGAISLSGIIALANDYTYSAATNPTTLKGTSTLYFAGYGTAATITDTTTSPTLGSSLYNNISFAPTSSTTYTIVGSLTANSGLLSFNKGSKVTTLNGGNLYANAGINTGTSTGTSLGTTIVNVEGSTAQTIAGGGAGLTIPSLKINAIPLATSVTLTGSIALANDYTYASGTLTTTGATLVFKKAAAQTITDTGTANSALNNVTFASGNASAYTLSGTMTVGGALTFANTTAGSTLTTGTIIFTGTGATNRVSYTGSSSGGGDTFLMTFTGAAPQISNTSGSVTAVTTGNITVNAGKNLTFTGGSSTFGTTTGSTLNCALGAVTCATIDTTGPYTINFKAITLNGNTFKLNNATLNVLKVNNATIVAGGFLGGTVAN